MANANIRHEVFCFTRYNIQRILGSPKLYLILIILSCYILQLVFCPRTLDGPIQYLSIHKTNLTVLEPYILIVNGYYPLQFIMIGFILLISDAPFLEAGIGNYLIRSKRSRWFLGQIAYILFLSVIYNIFLLLITTLPFIPYLRLSTNWSPLIQNYFSLQVDTNYSLAFADTSIADTFLLFLKDISPLYAWVITMLNSLLWMTTLGIVYLTISLYSNSSLSLFVIGIFYVLEILRNGIGFFPYEFDLNPDILILDEPFNGLDKDSVKEMRSLLLSLRDAGKLILLASHNPLDISLLCDSAFEIDRGMLFPFEITKSQNVVE